MLYDSWGRETLSLQVENFHLSYMHLSMHQLRYLVNNMIPYAFLRDCLGQGFYYCEKTP